MIGARVQKDGDRWTMILVRELRHPPEKVWQALTDPEELKEWAPFDADGNMGVEGSVVKLTTARVPRAAATETKILRAEAPRVLEYQWGGNPMKWELEATAEGTRLTLWASIDKRYISMGAAGWHICFDVLDRYLAGQSLGRRVGPQLMSDESWQRLNKEYAKQFAVEE